MKDKKNTNEILDKKPGYILAFTLIVVAVLLLMSLAVSRIIAKEMFFSRLVDNSRAAYFAADSGLECAQYLDSNIKDNITGVSLIINSLDGVESGKVLMEKNITDYVFSPSSTIYYTNTNFTTNDNLDAIKSKIYCASDGTNEENLILKNYANSAEEVQTNLDNKISSYNIVGTIYNATTTFGLVLKQKNYNNDDMYRCVLVEFAKYKSADTATGTSEYFSISSTGYSSCNSNDKSRVSRTIYRYFTD